MSKKWFLLTAGLDPLEIQLAARRVEKSSAKLYDFAKIINVSASDLPIFAPKLYSKYPGIFSSKTTGYGFYSWKIELVASALNGDYGPCDGVVWVDAGCEVFPTLLNRWIFKRSIQDCEVRGYRFFELDTREELFTKAKTFEYFQIGSKERISPQVQATTFMLYGEVGRRIANLAFETVYGDLESISDNLGNGDRENGVMHKFDQSILSLTIKSLELNNRVKVPAAGNRGVISQIRAIATPIWVSRNRHGKSIIPAWLRFMIKG